MIATLAEILLSKHYTLSVAESCTGGLLSAEATRLSGSSRWYQGGVIAYSNAVKEHLLGVPHAILERDGAVSREVAKAMAEGVRRSLDTDVALATTGLAGPTGGTAEKPVGTVWIACATPHSTHAKLLHCQGDRQAIQMQSVAESLRYAIDILSKTNS